MNHQVSTLQLYKFDDPIFNLKVQLQLPQFVRNDLFKLTIYKVVDFAFTLTAFLCYNCLKVSWYRKLEINYATHDDAV